MTFVMDTKTALSTAIDTVGTQTELAEQLTQLMRKYPTINHRVITQGHVATWLRRGRVPGDMCGLIEALTHVPKQQLRPDLFYDS